MMENWEVEARELSRLAKVRCQEVCLEHQDDTLAFCTMMHGSERMQDGDKGIDWGIL